MLRSWLQKLSRSRKPDVDISGTLRPELNAIENSDQELLELAKESFEEVIRLTEYEDQKANRILTTFGFLTALAGAVSVVLLPRTEQNILLPIPEWTSGHLVFFGLFFLYLFLVTLGACLVLWAIKPRFNIPAAWAADASSSEPPRSRLFFAIILKAHPKTWGQYFRQATTAEVKLDYLRDYLHETYLIADKIRTKLRFLQPGLSVLWAGSFVLVFWVICIPLTLTGTRSASSSAGAGGYDKVITNERPTRRQDWSDSETGAAEDLRTSSPQVSSFNTPPSSLRSAPTATAHAGGED